MSTRFSSVGRVAATLFLAGTLSVASAGTIYISDGTGIYTYTAQGTNKTYFSSGGTLNALAFNSSGTLYSSDRDNNKISAYTPAGVQSTFATVNGPYGMAIDGAGNVYTGANYGGTIMKYTPGGVGSIFASGQNVGPGDLAFDASGNLFAAENQTIYEFAPDGTRTTFATAPGFITGIAFDAAGDLFAADWNTCCTPGGATVDKYTPGGTRSVFATMGANQLPSSIAVDLGTGTVYVGEVQNGISNFGEQTVYAITAGGSMSTFASGEYLPWGIAVSSPSGATPEPGTILLSCAGLLALGSRRYSRRNRVK